MIYPLIAEIMTILESVPGAIAPGRYAGVLGCRHAGRVRTVRQHKAWGVSPGIIDDTDPKRLRRREQQRAMLVALTFGE